MKKITALILGLFFMVALASCEINLSINPNLSSTHTHVYNKKVVKPTCTENGYTEYDCMYCVYRYTDDIVDALGHDVAIEKGYAKSCTKDGMSDGEYCTRCKVTLKSREVIPHGHEYEYEGYVDATCTKDGYATSAKCKLCGDKKILTTIPAKGHDLDDGKVVTNELNHSLVEHTCKTCNEQVYDSLTIEYTQNYDYQALGSYYSNGSKYQQMYSKFYSACMKVLNSKEDYKENKTISGVSYYSIIDCELNGVSFDECGALITSFILNNPQFYFLKLGYYAGSSKAVFLIMDSAYLKGSTRTAIEKNIKKTEQDFYSAYLENSKKTDYDKAKFIHDYICDTIAYEWYDEANKIASNEIWAHSILGLMDQDESTGGVCECYAKCYLYFSNMVGLRSLIVGGTAGGGHAWNYSRINDAWYGVDATWDDGKTISTEYLLCGKDTMDEKHTPGVTNVNYNQQTEIFNVPLPELSLVAYA